MPTEARPRRGVVAVVDAVAAIVRTELACVRALWAPDSAEISAEVANAFDEKVRILGGDLDGANAAIEACESVVADGGRAAAIVSARSLADARRSIARLVERRRALVIHAIVAPRGAATASDAFGDVHALAHLGIGLLHARDAQDAADLSLVAHRAAEDAEAPVVVVHDGYPASYARDRVVLPDPPLVRAALEAAAPAPHAHADDDSAPAHRRAAARIPFALGSAMRIFERLTGRKLDTLESIPAANAELAIVASGSIAETARAVVERARTQDPPLSIALVQIVSLRPFPGAQLVKALARARRVAVLDRVDTPLAQSNPLALEVKAAFADALTWTPGYPGVGRIPEIFAGSVEPSARATTPAELLAAVDNLLLGEQGRRVFHLGGDHPAGLTPRASHDAHPDGSFSISHPHEPSLLVHLLADLAAAHVRATPRIGGADRADAFDLTVARDVVRAYHGAELLDVIVADRALDDAALARLKDGGAIALFGAAASSLSSKARASIRARSASVFALSAADPIARDAAVAGLALRLHAPSIDRRQALVEAERSLRSASPSIGDADVKRAIDALEASFGASPADLA